MGGGRRIPPPGSNDTRDVDFGGTREVKSEHRFDVARLGQWMAEAIPGFSGPLSVEQFKGGQSNPTYKLTTPGRAYVLRRQPPGDLLPGAHAVDREYRVIAALAEQAFPVARPYALCLDRSVVGTAFYIMEMVEGRIFWDGALPGLSPEARGRHFDAMNATVARLHGVDVQAAGLADYGKPGDYVARQLARWSRQYREDEAAGRDPAIDALVEELPRLAPASDETCLVHGDLRADNMIFHADRPEVAAVLDWELSTLGHPVADFAYHLMMYRLPPNILGGFAGAPLDALGIPAEADYVARYCERTGRDIGPHLDFYVAFNMFRLAAIFHGVKGRLARGTAASDHAHVLAAQVPIVAELARRQLG
jgi:aminoglycoside phosphotransferase (APT) family kinase protein